MDEPLTDLERAVLDWEAAHPIWKYAGARERRIRETFGWSPTRHAQVLNALLERPEALAYDAQLVHRLQRLREVRRGQRSADQRAPVVRPET